MKKINNCLSILQVGSRKIVEDVVDGSIPSTSTGITKEKGKKRKYAAIRTVEWVSRKGSKLNKFFENAQVGDLLINQGDSVTLPNVNGDGPEQIAYVAYMFEEGKEKMFHAHFYFRGSDTILGSRANCSELFVTKFCQNVELSSIIGKVKVSKKIYNSTWQRDGGSKGQSRIQKKQDKTSFYYSKIFEKKTSRFVDFVDVPEAKCMSCFWKQQEKDRNNIKVKTTANGDLFVEGKGEKYYVGTAVFIDYEREPVLKVRKKKQLPKKVEVPIKKERPKTRVMPRRKQEPERNEESDKENVCLTPAIVNRSKRLLNDRDMRYIFPEKYRNPGSHEHFERPCEPYTVGVIEKIHNNGRTAIREFWRVEDTTQTHTYGDPNLLYYTKCLYYIANLTEWASVIKGKCFVSHTKHIPDRFQWIHQGPYRFYFEQSYNPHTEAYGNLPQGSENIGLPGSNPESPAPWPTLETKLNCMDIYAGCGGLTNGLEQSGCIETKWAIEYDSDTADAFKLNHPTAKVLARDCNDVLNLLISGKQSKLGLPKKGEVDVIAGGPPCQGFSVLNQHATADKSLKNNSQIYTYLGFIDYYRPKYFIFENVENFVQTDDARYFQMFLKRVLEIGYQVTFGILHVGNFGIPQSRHRIFVIGAAPGLELPIMPEKTHCFGHFEKKIHFIKVDNVLYDNGGDIGVWGSLPFRRTTVSDAIADLPQINYDSMSEEMPYEERPDLSTYVRFLRENCQPKNLVKDHVCKKFDPIYQKRMELIPPGGDWTDLPNLRLTYLKGDAYTLTDVLQYSYSTDKKGKPVKKVESLSDLPTIIPFSIASTESDWKGVFGRVTWDGHFETVLTKPNPSGFQGRVIHPDQHRILTVRECARAQGFPDSFQFCGTIHKKYQQVGNAVAPLLALALGRTIGKAEMTHHNK
ncbi:unnamed protein product [Ceutorhynchus assimilis]|uniref:Cytosine-specific methyltransferase n=1 Tax=Ceutorhynchus assimilis TaxID=467358 RepID=A0A9N9MDP2_9CUCU|nr:unnamed protein product [Ceutorhynchus assimilis]